MLDGEDVEPEPVLPAAPWSVAPLAADAVPELYLAEWRKADNRATCAPLVADRQDEGGRYALRRAEFSGGWGVAYDLPRLRSAFGVAGAGIEPSEDQYVFPNELRWADGSHASYGPEGGSGPGWVAYLVVVDQGCLYNLWSKHGQAHMEALIASLRRVESRSGEGGAE